jgi:peptide/nickel transport system substrate-binding protein
MRRRTITPTMLAVLALVLSACGAQVSQSVTPPTEEPGTAEPSADSSSAPTGDVETGGILRVMLVQDEGQGFDPAIVTYSTSFFIAQQMFDSLAEIQPDGEITPALAESWEISDDELTYVFTLRQGVMFHDGTEMTADDVKFTIDRIRDPATASPRARLYSAVESVEVTGDYEVTFTLSEPFAPLLAALADISSGIVSDEAVEAAGADFFANPVGTGAFKFDNWVEGQSVELVRNDDYWMEGRPYLDGMTFTFNSDANARASAVRAGDVDFLYDASADLVPVFEGDEAVEVYSPEGQMSWLYLLLNIQREPFDDVRVRQAIYWALDRQELSDLPGKSKPLNAGFLPASHWGGTDEVIYTQDYDRAQELLTEAGVGEGFAFTINSLVGWGFQNCTAQTIQAQLQPLNIDVTVDIMENGLMAAERDQEDMSSDAAMDAMVIGFSGTIDPDERFQQTFLAGGGTNYVDFTDEEIEALAVEARQTSDREERGELYRQAQMRLAEVGPFAFLYNYYKIDIARDEVKGYVFNPQLISYRQLRDVWLDQ